MVQWVTKDHVMQVGGDLNMVHVAMGDQKPMTQAEQGPCCKAPEHNTTPDTGEFQLTY